MPLSDEERKRKKRDYMRKWRADNPDRARETKLNQLLGGIKQSEYEFDLTVLGSYFSTNALIVI